MKSGRKFKHLIHLLDDKLPSIKIWLTDTNRSLEMDSLVLNKANVLDRLCVLTALTILLEKMH